MVGVKSARETIIEQHFMPDGNPHHKRAASRLEQATDRRAVHIQCDDRVLVRERPGGQPGQKAPWPHFNQQVNLFSQSLQRRQELNGLHDLFVQQRREIRITVE